MSKRLTGCPAFYYRITFGTAVRGKSCEFIGMEVQREVPIWVGDMRQSGWISGKLKKLSVKLQIFRQFQVLHLHARPFANFDIPISSFLL
jgi:hypothetical protein